MNFKQLEAFYWLSKLHSYQRVADHIGLTQPAVSARIAGLEAQLEAKLVDRTATQFRLTDQGLEVAEYAERFLNLHEAMTARLRQRYRRRFSIGLVGPAALTWGVTLRQKARQLEDGTIVDFHIGSNVQLQQEVDAGSLDMAFLTDEAGVAQVLDGFLVRYAVGWAARPDVVGEITQPLTPQQLRELPLILYPRTSPLFSPIANYIDEAKRRPSARHFGNSLSTLVEMLRLGYGASAVPLAAVEQDLAHGMLIELPTTVALEPFNVRCIHVTGARKRQAMQILELARKAAWEWCEAHPRYTSYEGPRHPAA